MTQQPARPIDLRLCDDDGMVSDKRVTVGHPGRTFDPALTYRKALNNLRAQNRDPDHRAPYTGDPFPCTGSAHLAGETFHCTSPAHRPRSVVSVPVAGVTLAPPLVPGPPSNGAVTEPMLWNAVANG